MLNPFYNMEYKIIKKIGQNKMWMEADIPCFSKTPCWLTFFLFLIISCPTSGNLSVDFYENMLCFIFGTWTGSAINMKPVDYGKIYGKFCSSGEIFVAYSDCRSAM